MIRIPALDLILEQDTLGRLIERWVPRSNMLRDIRAELLSERIRLFIDGKIPLLGDRLVTADLSASVRGNELMLRLEHTSVPLISKAAIASLVASQAKVDALRAEGACLILDLELLFQQYEIAARIHSLTIEQGQIRLLCLNE